MKKLIIVASIAALGACSTENPNASEENKAKLALKNDHSTSVPLSTSTVNTNSKIEAAQHRDFLKSYTPKSEKTKNASSSVVINKQKFITDDPDIKVGQSLFNVDIQEHGVVKNSIVVISSEIPRWLDKQFFINKIAKQTYRLTSVSADADIYKWYIEIAKDARFSTVELEIDYSGVVNKPELY